MAREKSKNRKPGNQKVSSSQGNNDEVTDNEPEVWDVVKVINPKECEKPTCRLDGCKETAVAVWAIKNNTDDTWPVCEDCQVTEFGGWPEGVEPPEDDDTDHSVPKDEHENQTAGEAKQEIRSESPENKASGTKNENEETPVNVVDDEDAWHLVQVLSKKAVTSRNYIKCMTDDCDVRAACVYVKSYAPNNKWFTCLDCQESKFGGWPDEKDLPVNFMTDEHKEALIVNCATTSAIKMPVFNSKTPENNGKIRAISPETGSENAIESPGMPEDENDEETEAEEVWDLVKIIGIDALLIDSPIKCSTETCLLPAACVYVSSQAPKDKWYTCLDCQEKDYGGWPEVEDLPVKLISHEHQQVLKEKCSNQPGVKMPDFDPKTPCDKTPQTSNKFFSLENEPDATQNENANGNSNIISPLPSMPEKAKKQPSKEALALHKKWLEEAEALGGSGARIIVCKTTAKEKISEAIFDTFRPMNITEIFQTLKGIIPKPVLKTCLDDMVKGKANAFQDSDSDDEHSQREKNSQGVSANSDPYAGILFLKASKNVNAAVYYVDYNKAKNGSGLDPDERNELYAQSTQAVLEEEALQAKIKFTKDSTKDLLSQPTNEELVMRLDEAEVSLLKTTEKVEVARELKVDEKKKEQTKRRVENFTSEWRKRRRLTMDFLFSMEELSDGTVSAKKCLSGDGQIEMDSDEVVEKQAIAYAKKQRACPSKVFKKTNATETGDGDAISPNRNFVAVRLNSQNMVERVLLDVNIVE